MEIKVINDGKGKHQSFEAIIRDRDFNGYGDYDIDIVGYGEDEESARESLSNILIDLITELNDLLK